MDASLDLMIVNFSTPSDQMYWWMSGRFAPLASSSGPMRKIASSADPVGRTMLSMRAEDQDLSDMDLRCAPGGAKSRTNRASGCTGCLFKFCSDTVLGPSDLLVVDPCLMPATGNPLD